MIHEYLGWSIYKEGLNTLEEGIVRLVKSQGSKYQNEKILALTQDFINKQLKINKTKYFRLRRYDEV